MKAWKAILLGALVFLGPAAWSYIPDYHMIMSRVAESHGRGIYKIEQDVIFNSDAEPLVVREIWHIKDENTMALQVRGRGALNGLIKLNYVYQGGVRYQVDSSGKVRKGRVPEEALEPFFHFRFSKNIKPRLVSLNVAPQSSTKDRQIQKTDDGKVAYTSQDFLRLARVGGVVTYAIGTPTPAGSGKLNPGMWIEQDHFVIRKMRFPSSMEVTAEDYTSYPRSMWLPRLRSVRWDSKGAQIQVTDVKPLGYTKVTQNLVSPKSLDSRLNLTLPDQEAIRDFYTRFR